MQRKAIFTSNICHKPMFTIEIIHFVFYIIVQIFIKSSFIIGNEQINIYLKESEIY